MHLQEPRVLGAQIFSYVPRSLRSYALQIQCVIEGLKPACLIPLYINGLEECITFLRERGLTITVDQLPIGPYSYAQTNPAARKEVMVKPRVRLYIAKSAGDARQLARLETELRDYYQLGRALGYPVCCVAAAVENDQLTYVERYGVWKQTNLNAVGTQVSTKLDYLCNFFLGESELSTVAPVSALAHWPCHFACDESRTVGGLALECCARTWPCWSDPLIEVLKAPVIYWPDVSWPPEYWDEYCGISLVSAYGESYSLWRSNFSAITLGHGRTPAGEFPADITAVQVAAEGIALYDKAHSLTFVPFDKTGNPWLIDWGSGSIRTLP